MSSSSSFDSIVLLRSAISIPRERHAFTPKTGRYEYVDTTKMSVSSFPHLRSSFNPRFRTRTSRCTSGSCASRASTSSVVSEASSSFVHLPFFRSVSL